MMRLNRSLTKFQSDIFEHRGRTSPIMPGAKIPAPQSSPALLNLKHQGSQTRVLTLNNGEHLDSTLFRLEKGWILHLSPGPSLMGHKVLVYCNYPENEQSEFIRNQYCVLQWHRANQENIYGSSCTIGTGVIIQDTDMYCEIIANKAGAYHFYFIYEDVANTVGPQGSGFFQIAPTLNCGRNNQEILELDCIQCQTVLCKSLGPFVTWENKLRVAKESGYNMIHFTPIQELGGSNSSYSIADQLRLNPIFSAEAGREITYFDVENLVSKMKSEWKVLSICDIVLNHTANESSWLLEHPEATYNVYNCPHLRPAFLLDALLAKLTNDIGRGDYESWGIPSRVTQNQHLDIIKNLLLSQLLPEAKIHELYLCNVNDIIQEFSTLARNKVPPVATSESENKELKIVQDSQYRRLKSYVDMESALRLFNIYRSDCFDEDTRIKKCCEELKGELESLNHKMYEEIQSHLIYAIDNCMAGMRYFRIQEDGPKVEEVTVKNPLVPRYFTYHGTISNIKEMENKMYTLDARFMMAHNGWVMNADPLKDFANVKDGIANVYLRRELIAWGDSVKLRYGEKPEDVPFLWKHMREYVEATARTFDGVRLDNCHSTPLHVAEYLLDCARKVRPDLYVVAELFTNSDQTDNIFVNRLGITSLIREALSAWDSHELGRLVYRFGGSPAGAFIQPPRRPLTPSIAHALFLDLTHDNPSPVEKRSVYDLLPSAALVSMACCASGSNRGYDELVPHHIHVVDEYRQYTEWMSDYNASNTAESHQSQINIQTGIIAAKKALNQLHYELGSRGFEQVYVDQMDADIVAVTRHNPKSHQTVVLVAFTAFSQPEKHYSGRGIKPLRFEGKLEEIIFEVGLNHIETKSGERIFQKPKSYVRNSTIINGLNEYETTIKQNIQLNQSTVFHNHERYEGTFTILEFKDFYPGSVVAIRISMQDEIKSAFTKLHQIADIFHTLPYEGIINQLGISNIICNLSLTDLNTCLYVCDQEEKDNGGSGVYDIPGYGPLFYAGLQGFVSLLGEIRPNNDLGHPLCRNLREGNWMIDYIWQRLEKYSNLSDLCKWYQTIFQTLKEVPRFLIPCYFDMMITGIYQILIKTCYKLMSDFIRCGSSFEKALALGSVQFTGIVNSVALPPMSPHLPPPRLPQIPGTMSAGLPHFTTGYMRCWGRDTFIALRGMYILTGRYQEARHYILAFGACLRHGLIPNLLDGGKNSRYNCRDALWWWLYSIRCYCVEVPNGYVILQDIVSRVFPTDDAQPHGPGQVDQLLQDVIQEALNIHFQGIAFRERNAGRSIDAHMSDKGFNNQIGIHPETGFVFGGNDANCGTWMDKMGSSDAAGNRGKPATPRDGSAVELVGLSKAVISWLAIANVEGKYPYSGVQRKHRDGAVTSWSFIQWSDKIQQNFERYFWIHITPAANDTRPDLIHRRGIYKDSYGATQAWADHQLRCNFTIAMVVAPELFDPQHAWIALNNMKSLLVAPLGMKTLDPEDWAYCGDYDNSNQSNDPKVAHGFNYHQGPEWVWPIGFYLRARLHFAQENNCLRKTVAETYSILSRHLTELQSTHWRGLPELTNNNGAFCSDSCRTQAWSMGCVLEVLYEIRQWENKQSVILNTEDN